MNDQQNFYEQKLRYEADSAYFYELINKGDKVIVIDTRSVEAFDEEHIPGGINIPHRTMNELSTSYLGKKALYFTYCDGIGCNASTKGALNMTKLGIRVKELIGGLDWWKRDGYQIHGMKSNKCRQVNCAC